MENRIQTNKLEDLLAIFSPDAQETEDTGGARILYTFDNSEQPVRQRVGNTFILDVLSPTATFFISLPVDAFVEEGTIAPAFAQDELQPYYQLTEQDLLQLIQDVSVALNYASDEDILALIQQ